jgi:hypothetical protein
VKSTTLKSLPRLPRILQLTPHSQPCVSLPSSVLTHQDSMSQGHRARDYEQAPPRLLAAPARPRLKLTILPLPLDAFQQPAWHSRLRDPSVMANSTCGYHSVVSGIRRLRPSLCLSICPFLVISRNKFCQTSSHKYELGILGMNVMNYNAKARYIRGV